MTDWAKLIAELEGTGLSLYKIALAVDLQYNQIKAIKEGREPKHYTGERLKAFHMRRIDIQVRT